MKQQVNTCSLMYLTEVQFHLAQQNVWSEWNESSIDSTGKMSHCHFWTIWDSKPFKCLFHGLFQISKYWSTNIWLKMVLKDQRSVAPSSLIKNYFQTTTSCITFAVPEVHPCLQIVCLQMMQSVFLQVQLPHQHITILFCSDFSSSSLFARSFKNRF